MKQSDYRAWILTVLLPGAFFFPPSPAYSQEFDCLIEPEVVTTLSFPLAGIIESVKVGRGDFVKKGQVVATMKSGVERATVAIARARARSDADLKMQNARLELGTRRFDRNVKLFRDKVISGREIDDVRTTKEIAKLELMQAREEKRIANLELRRERALLRLRTLRSPINGVVVERSLSPGEFSNQSPVLKLAQINPLRVEVFVPVSMLGKISLEMEARVIPESPVGGSYTARVSVVDQVVDASSGTFGVRLKLPNPGNRLPAGLKCRVLFSQGQ